MINLINNRNVYHLDLQMVQEKDHSNNLSQENCPKWDLADAEQPLINIREYFKLLHGSNYVPCYYMIQKDIVPVEHINNISCSTGTQMPR